MKNLEFSNYEYEETTDYENSELLTEDKEELEQKCESISLNCLDLFMKDLLNEKIEKIPLKRQLELGKLIKEGNTEARDELVKSYLPLTVEIAKKSYYAKRDTTKSCVLLEDLIQEGCIGLLEAADAYDYTLGYSFGTFAYMRIFKKVNIEVNQAGKVIKIPTATLQKYQKVAKFITEFENENQRRPTVEEICDKTGFSESNIKDIIELLLTQDVVSLNKEFHFDSNSDTCEYEDIIADNSTSIEDTLTNKIDEENLMNLLKDALTEIEFKIVSHKLGLFGYEEIDGFNNIGKILEISRETARNRYNSAKQKIQSNAEILKYLRK